jgi:hypothetical protein
MTQVSKTVLRKLSRKRHPCSVLRRPPRRADCPSDVTEIGQLGSLALRRELSNARISPLGVAANGDGFDRISLPFARTKWNITPNGPGIPRNVGEKACHRICSVPIKVTRRNLRMSLEPATPEEIAVLARRAGLKLAKEHFEELVEAYGYVEQMLARLRRARSYADEPAHIFVPIKFIFGEE